MGVFVLLLLLTAPMLAAMLAASVVGLVAFVRACRSAGPQAFVLSLLAVQLWEPAVTFILGVLGPACDLCYGPLGFLAFTDPDSNTRVALLSKAFVIAAMLLAPVLGLRLADPYYRQRSLRILGLGAVRLSLYLAIVSCHMLAESVFPAVLLIELFIIEVGMQLFAVVWGYRELRYRLWVRRRCARADSAVLSVRMPHPSRQRSFP
jgi:hypothetical protein